MNRKPKIIIWDIETTPIVANVWDLKPNWLSPDNIIRDWSIICAAWKELGSKSTKAVSIHTVGDDYEVVKKLREVLADADLLIHHNGDQFDLKKFNTRLIFHSLPPIPKIPTIDTKKVAKKVAAFSSNKLDYLGKFLLGEGKVHVEYQLWLDVMAGSKKALKTMVDYNKVDVVRLEQLYERLKPYIDNHPHVGVFAGEDRLCSCRVCGSVNLKKNGVRITASGLKRQEMQCNDCGGYTRTTLETV
jgi:DNA polymerase elongation subunit (family B)